MPLKFEEKCFLTRFWTLIQIYAFCLKYKRKKPTKQPFYWNPQYHSTWSPTWPNKALANLVTNLTKPSLDPDKIWARSRHYNQTGHHPTTTSKLFKLESWRFLFYNSSPGPGVDTIIKQAKFIWTNPKWATTLTISIFTHGNYIKYHWYQSNFPFKGK